MALTSPLTFTSTLGEDGTITNTFVNVTDQHVDKFWEEPEGTFTQFPPTREGASATEATVVLYAQDDTVIGEFTLDGTPESEATPIEDLPQACRRASPRPHLPGDGLSTAWNFENLPKYSQTGHKYTYLVLEQQAEGWYTEREYDPATRTTTIRNHIPVGEGTELYVTKRWVDGDDAAQRPERAGARHRQGRPALPADRPADRRSPCASSRPARWGSPIRSWLSESNNWFEEFGVSVGGVTDDDLIIEETGLRYPGSDVVYPVVSIDEAQEAYPGAEWINVGWTNPDNKRVATDNHVYEVAPGSVNQVKNAWEIT